MAATIGSRSSVIEDPQYRQAASYLHSGQWDQAIRLLEDLRSHHPDDKRIERMLEDARFKANLEGQTTIKEKRWIVPWRPIAMRVLILLTAVLVIGLGFGIMRFRVLPMIASIQEEYRRDQLLSAAKSFLAGGDLDAAQEKFQALLTLEPENTDALAGLEEIDRQRDLFQRYNEAVAAENAGQSELAMALFNDLQLMAPGYRDVNNHILGLRHKEELTALFNRASTLRALGMESDAIETLLQIQSLDVNYRRAEVDDLLFALNLKQGQRIVTQTPPVVAELPIALEHFNNALQKKPNDATALIEARLVVNFLDGKEAFDRGYWSEAVYRLRTVYQERPNYLSGALINLFYQALLAAGDLHQANNNLLDAYEMYRQAVDLPLIDTVSAQGKLNALIPILTPTPTPTLTPTPAPTATPAPSATPTPTATPRPLIGFRNRIVFKSDNPDQPGFWAMNPDGTNREFLGDFKLYEPQFDALRESERFSPDKRYRVYTADVDKNPQIMMELPIDPKWGQLPPKVVTRLTGMAYDPVWSPDGSWIAFATQENTSDDIWVVRPDSSEVKALINNDWEWDKHPSWSPDGSRIAFFSNRFGVTQIFVMNSEGQDVRNISNVPWPEYDPIWVK
ncbi:MAG: PD40 domain-containing protein [Caldilineaceae bacterium]|nr:PD40 domain-containing protein [Caldilineaceae bacterium]